MKYRIFARENSGNFKGIPISSGSFETLMEIPPEKGDGFIKAINFKCGVSLGILNYRVSNPLTTIRKDNDPFLGFSFSISGNTRMKLPYFKDDIYLKDEKCCAFYFPEESGVCEDKPGDNIKRVTIQMSPDVLREFAGDDFLFFSENCSCHNCMNSSGSITPSMKIVLGQIINCPYAEGNIRQLFLEAKVLELLAYKLEQLLSLKSMCNCRPNLKPRFAEQAHAAAEILMNSFQNPPSLSELCVLVGLSRNRLLYSFKKVYGNTPAEFVRNIRLDKAKYLIESGEMNVTEAAYFVGYSSLSHFSVVFKTYHGLLPGDL